MNAGRAKKIRQMIGYDIGNDDIQTRRYTQNGKTECVGIRKKYKQFKKSLNKSKTGAR